MCTTGVTLLCLTLPNIVENLYFGKMKNQNNEVIHCPEWQVAFVRGLTYLDSPSPSIPQSQGYKSCTFFHL